MKIYNLDNYTAVNFDLRIQIAEVAFIEHSEVQGLFIAPTVNDEYSQAAAYLTTNGEPIKFAVEMDGEWVLTEDTDGETFDFTKVEYSILESPHRWERDRLGEWSHRLSQWTAGV